MEDLPHIENLWRSSLTIPLPAYLQDHHLQGRAVLPAVEAMEILVDAVHRCLPDVPVSHLSSVRFDKFLTIPEAQPKATVRAIIQQNAEGIVTARLQTRFVAPRSGIARDITHVRFEIGPASETWTPFPRIPEALAQGACYAITPDTVYHALVPFGPAYRNLAAPLRLTSRDALAQVCQARPADGPSSTWLGNPFILDAAFHAACVWGQRYRGIVSFPVAIGERIILRRTEAGIPYTAWVVPTANPDADLLYDIRIYDHQGEPREAALGVRMRDMGRGSWQPPHWIHTTPKANG